MRRKRWLIGGIIILIMMLFIVSTTKYGRVRDLSNVEEVVSVLSEGTDKSWKDITRINIFRQDEKIIDKDKIIYPGSKGIYKFVVKNQRNYDAAYQILFHDEHNIDIKMRYRFMTESDYLANKNSKWVTIDELKQNGVVSANSEDKYVLEWFWEEDNNDTEIGFIGGYYTLNLEVSSESL